MISVISPIQYGDTERSRLIGIRSGWGCIVKDVIRERIIQYLGNRAREKALKR